MVSAPHAALVQRTPSEPGESVEQAEGPSFIWSLAKIRVGQTGSNGRMPWL